MHFRNTGQDEVAIICPLAAMWARELSASEVVSMNANPWQIFQPETIMVPIDTAKPDLAIVERPW